MQASTFTPGFKTVSVASKARLSRARLAVEANVVKKKAPKGTSSVDVSTIEPRLVPDGLPWPLVYAIKGDSCPRALFFRISFTQNNLD